MSVVSQILFRKEHGACFKCDICGAFGPDSDGNFVVSVGAYLGDLDIVVLCKVVKVVLFLDLLEANLLHSDARIADTKSFLFLFNDAFDLCELFLEKRGLQAKIVVILNAVF